jgi:predicted dehydrogenase
VDEHGQVRWGIAATGRIAAEMVEALATVPGAVVAAVCSRSHEAADSFGDRYGIARRYGSYEAMAEDPDLDVVYVATPHNRHHDDTLLYLSHGKHVLCEKVFAMSADEARSMQAAAAASGRFLMEAMWSWHIPTWVEIRRRVAAGEIGEVRIVRSDFGFRLRQDSPRHTRPELGGGTVFDLGVYPIALTRFLLGSPSSVQVVGDVGPTGVDMTVGGVLGHASGAVGVFHTSFEADTSNTCDIFGTEGTIRVLRPFHAPTTFEVVRSDGNSERVEIAHRGLAHEAEHVQACLAESRLESDVMPLAESIAIMETVDEARRQLGLRG